MSATMADASSAGEENASGVLSAAPATPSLSTKPAVDASDAAEAPKTGQSAANSLYQRLKKRGTPIVNGIRAALTPGSALKIKAKHGTPGTAVAETPPARPAGVAGISAWLDNVNLGLVPGLLEAVLTVATDLEALRRVDQARFDAAIAPLKLKPKGIKYKKLQAELATLKGEVAAFVPKLAATEPEWFNGQLERPLVAPLDHDTSVTRVRIADMPPPIRPKIGDLRRNLNPNPPRFKSRVALGGAMPLPAALSSKQGSTEAKELQDLASLFGNDGEKMSRRADHARVVTRAQSAAMRVQHENAARTTTTPGSQAKPADLLGDFAATERQLPNGRVGLKGYALLLARSARPRSLRMAATC